MNGAESLVRTLVACGVTTCFANPGTSATGEWPNRRPRHCCMGPGLANGLANLHNARRAATPIVNVVGNHATYHEQYDPPLASDVGIESSRATTIEEFADQFGHAMRERGPRLIEVVL